MRSSPAALLTGCLLVLGGCVNEGRPSPTPTVLPVEKIALPPPPQRPLAVGVYGCIDTTGQRRPTGAPQELSTAVPLDCSPYLIDAIQSLSPGYVYLVERGHVDDLLRERQLATLAMNTDPPGAEHPQGSPRRLATLRVAEILLVGQVVAYDRATKQVSTGLAIGGAGGDGTLVTDLSPSACVPWRCRPARCWARPPPPNRSLRCASPDTAHRFSRHPSWNSRWGPRETKRSGWH
jgi:curli biogenesis system outer membrane secretion channel CsgG